MVTTSSKDFMKFQHASGISPSESPRDIEEKPKLVDIFGECGTYQVVFLLWCCYISMTFGFTTLSVTFLAPELNYTCNVNLEHRKLNVQVSEDQCSYTIQNVSQQRSYNCEKWFYSHDFYGKDATLTEQFNLVCGRSWLISFANSVQQIGDFVASFIISHSSDRYGRRPITVFAVIPGIIAYIFYLVNYNIELFLFAKFLSGFCGISVNYLSFVILMEMIGEPYRGMFGIISINLGWTFAYAALPGIYFLLRNEFYFQIFSACVCFPLILSYWIVPESARWLLLNHKTDEALKVVARMKRVNQKKSFVLEDVKKQLQEVERNLTDSQNSETFTSVNFLDLIRGREMRKRTICMYFAWFTVGFVYFGISLNASILSGDLYLNFFYLAIIEVPSTLFGIILDKYMGRKPLLMLSMLLTGAMYLITLAVPQSMTGAQIALVILSKFFVSASFLFLYAYTSELFPTCIRSIGVCGGSGAARFGSVIAPFAAELTKVTNLSATFGLFGVLSIVSGALIFFLPETKHKPLPETLDDVNNTNRIV